MWIKNFGWVISVALSDRWLAAGNDKGGVYLWDFDSDDRHDSAVQLPDHRDRVTTLISPDGSRLATISYKVRLFDLDSEDPKLAYTELTGHAGLIENAVISQSSRWLITESQGTIRLWDLRSDDAESAMELQANGQVSSLAVSADDRWLIAGRTNSTALLWDLDNADALPLVVRGDKGAMMSVALTPDCRMLVTGGGDGIARIWEIDVDALIGRLSPHVGRDLTPEEKTLYDVLDN